LAEFEWKIAKPGEGCAECKAPFKIEQAYYSALVQTPESLQRLDYCADCFQQKRPENVYYFWKSVRPDPENDTRNKVRKPVLDIDFVTDFFKRLEDDNGPQKVAFRYILALMLARKKVLIAEGKSKDASGQDVHIFREKRGGQSHKVFEPSLSEEEIASVSTELGTLLGLTPPPAPVASAAPAETAETGTTDIPNQTPALTADIQTGESQK
jgi:hypothetical protein